jgi:hypothetical protein
VASNTCVSLPSFVPPPLPLPWFLRPFAGHKGKVRPFAVDRAHRAVCTDCSSTTENTLRPSTHILPFPPALLCPLPNRQHRTAAAPQRRHRNRHQGAAHRGIVRLEAKAGARCAARDRRFPRPPPPPVCARRQAIVPRDRPRTRLDCGGHWRERERERETTLLPGIPGDAMDQSTAKGNRIVDVWRIHHPSGRTHVQ